MSHPNVAHRRTHNLLLISKLLNQRDATSPFTLVLDSLEQSAKPLVREYIRRANVAKTHIAFLGFETSRAPAGVDVFVPCYGKSPAQIGQAVGQAISSMKGKRNHHLLIIDSLHPLCTLSIQQPTSFNITHFLSSLIAPTPSPNPQSLSSPQSQPPPTSTTSLVAIYHQDIPLPAPKQAYTPSPLTLLSYLATTLLTIHPLPHLLASKAASDRSLAPPSYGLDEAREGVVKGLPPARFSRHIPPDQRGIVLELEHRRKSGRGVREWFFLPTGTATKASSTSTLALLDDHPLFRPKRTEGEENAEQLAGLTFELGLTERQKMEREGVVLPYFDAQKDRGGGDGPGEGGRILYDMGAEDDFDEEEDEI